MLTLEVLLAATLGVPGTAGMLAAPAADQPAADEPDLREAKRLFNEGLARYDSADYEGAIETFMLALSEVRSRGVDDFRVVGPLLFNIGRARVRAYEIDRNVEHLRQAEAIFSRFLDGAKAFPDEADERDVTDAQTQLEQLQAQLEQLEQSKPEPKPESPAVAPSDDDGRTDADAERRAARARGIGIGLTVAGVALLGGGVGMIVWGVGYGPAAESQAAEYEALGLPDDHPVFSEVAGFVDTERRKGTAWIAGGSVAATLGLTGLAVGIAQLVKAKRLRSSRPTPTALIGPEGVVVGVHGQF